MDRKSLLLKAAVDAGAWIKNAEPTDGLVEKEGRGNFVTAADLASEKIIIDLIRENFPQDHILSEETEAGLKDLLTIPNLWVIDPIDGTNNFRFGRNYSCVSIGYAENGIVQIGAVYDPYVNELFFAENGKGAFLNDRPLTIGSQLSIHDAAVATDNSYSPEIGKKHLELLLTINPSPFILIKGSAALMMCEVASGRTDLYFHTDIKPWDNAAGFLIIKEAGGVVKNFLGESVLFTSSEIVVGNTLLVDQFIAIAAPYLRQNPHTA